MASKLIGIVLIALLLVGCNNKATPEPTLAPTSTPLPDNPATIQTPPPAASDNSAGVSGVIPAWLTYKLTDVRGGKQFTLGDYKGKTVYVALLTTGCANCRAQLNNLKGAIGKLGKDKYGYVALGVDTAQKAEDLAKYANDGGFDWQFAVLPGELLAMWSLSFGRAAAEPVAATYFLIYPDGTVSKLFTGDVRSTDDLVKIISTPR